MFSTCLFCSRDLGTNEVLEVFPTGRRLAFDPDRGRLWVVCRRCERWNLVPMEERWEAVEDAERLFREVRMRVSTENIGLARHAEGLELVRIGRPVREEFAAWRYGDQFGRRRRRHLLYVAAGTVAGGALLVGNIATGFLSGGLLIQVPNIVRSIQDSRTVAHLTAPGGDELALKPPHVRGARFWEEDGDWVLTLKPKRKVVQFRGADARRAASLLLPVVNRSGGSEKMVRNAVSMIEAEGHPERFLRQAAPSPTRSSTGRGKLQDVSKEGRLALEMALHEEQERRVLEGELKGLEHVWRREEELASISDDLFLPEGTEERLRVLDSRGG